MLGSLTIRRPTERLMGRGNSRLVMGRWMGCERIGGIGPRGGIGDGRRSGLLIVRWRYGQMRRGRGRRGSGVWRIRCRFLWIMGGRIFRIGWEFDILLKWGSFWLTLKFPQVFPFVFYVGRSSWVKSRDLRMSRYGTHCKYHPTRQLLARSQLMLDSFPCYWFLCVLFECRLLECSILCLSIDSLCAAWMQIGGVRDSLQAYTKV